MSNIEFENQRFAVNNDETVLDCLLRHRQAIPHGCRAGACHACLLHCNSNTAGLSDAQRGLSLEQQQRQLFLSCQYRPSQDITVQRDHEKPRRKLEIIDKTLLSSTILRLRLACSWRWQAGQYLSIWDEALSPRCYSIASVSRLEPYIELQVQTYGDGAMSSKLLNDYHRGDTLDVDGPFGDCVYHPQHSGQDLLLISAGTGMSPLLAIARDALEQGHQGQVLLINSAKSQHRFYNIEILQALQAQYSNFSAVLCAEDVGEFSPSGITTATTVSHYLREQQADLRGNIIYLCGGQTFIEQYSKQCFMQSAKRRNIYCETFIDFAKGDSATGSESRS